MDFSRRTILMRGADAIIYNHFKYEQDISSIVKQKKIEITQLGSFKQSG